MRAVVIDEVLLAIVSHRLSNPPRIEVTGTILPLKSESQLDIVPTQISPCSSPTLTASPAPSASPDLPVSPSRDTAREAFCHKYPELSMALDLSVLGSSARFLLDLTARRSLDDNKRKKKPFSIRRKSNLKAALIQIAGVHHPPAVECLQCRKGRGLWTGCVTAPAQQYNALRRSCANCFYNGTGSKCSFINSHPPGSRTPLPPPQLDQDFGDLPADASIIFNVEIQSLEPFNINNNRTCHRRQKESIRVKVPLANVLNKLPPDTDDQSRAHFARIAFCERA
ncbi:hypothetical protein F4803DRAFT_427242 [Xylaria telfairii]|nr:hypothetical protein F4803DRAFT_427242 [Xylaria telfairii]